MLSGKKYECDTVCEYIILFIHHIGPAEEKLVVTAVIKNVKIKLQPSFWGSLRDYDTKLEKICMLSAGVIK